MRGVKISTTEEERDIGVIITKNLKQAAQCSKAAGRATSVLHQLGKNFLYRDRHTFVRLYKQYVRPHLEFASPAWAPHYVGDRDVIERVQEKAVRMVAGLKGADYTERCKELNLEKLQTRRERADLTLVHGYLGKENQKIFTLVSGDDRIRTRNTSGTKALMAQFSRADIRKNSFAVRTVEGWNRLPETLRQETRKDPFKRELKKVLE